MKITSTIESIEYRHNGLCWYYGNGDNNATVGLFYYDFKVCDSCGKFQIGDTLNLTKK